jgi:hypothetical protein
LLLSLFPLVFELALGLLAKIYFLGGSSDESLESDELLTAFLTAFDYTFFSSFDYFFTGFFYTTSEEEDDSESEDEDSTFFVAFFIQNKNNH